jgi:hypothetical protein
VAGTASVKMRSRPPFVSVLASWRPPLPAKAISRPVQPGLAKRNQSSSSSMNSRACFMEISECRVSAVAAASVSPLRAKVRIRP